MKARETFNVQRSTFNVQLPTVAFLYSFAFIFPSLLLLALLYFNLYFPIISFSHPPTPLTPSLNREGHSLGLTLAICSNRPLCPRGLMILCRSSLCPQPNCSYVLCQLIFCHLRIYFILPCPTASP